MPSDPNLDADFQAALKLHERGDWAGAIRAYAAIIARAPAHVPANYHQAMALLQLGRLGEALSAFDAVLRLQPGSVDAHAHRSNVLAGLGRYEEALRSAEIVLKVDPNNISALCAQGIALLDSRRPAEALVVFEHALKFHPNAAALHANRGNALATLKLFPEALASFDQALALEPGILGGWDGRGKVLRSLGRPDEAAAAFEELLRLAPGHHEALGNLFTARLHACDWRDYELLSRHVIEVAQHGRAIQTPLSFFLHGGKAKEQMALAKAHAARYPAQPPLWRGEVYRHARIRVAYVSADFAEHVVGQRTAQLFELHDRTAFEIYGISLSPSDGSALRARLEKGFDHFLDVSARSDEEAARILREREIDIAVDLTGYTQGERTGIFSYRPCPVQVMHFGYTGTLGVPYMDYLIADATVVKRADEAFYSEKIVRLPDSYFVASDIPGAAGAAPTRAACGLPDEGFVFACFSTLSKISPQVFDVWMRILKHVPGSVLWLRDGGEAAARNLRIQATRRNIDAARLIFAPRVAQDAHRARQQIADLFLDTTPYNAHVTAADTLAAGLPILACEGESFTARVGVSLLRAVGLPELGVGSLEDYEETAIRLANTPAVLADFKKRLAATMGSAPLFDANRYRSNIERAYRHMWKRAGTGQAPAPFDVVNS